MEEPAVLLGLLGWTCQFDSVADVFRIHPLLTGEVHPGVLGTKVSVLREWQQLVAEERLVEEEDLVAEEQLVVEEDLVAEQLVEEDR